MEYGPEEVARDLDAIRGGDAVAEVEARLEHLCLQTMAQGGLDGLAGLLRSVPRYRVQMLEHNTAQNEARYSCLGGDGPEVLVHACADPDLNFIDIRSSTESESDPPGDTDPRHDRFYSTWESMLRLDDEAVAKLDTPRRAVFLVGLLEAEVMNGGLGQYLTNTEGAFLESTLGLLDQIGATLTRQILARAVAVTSDTDSFVEAWDRKSEEFSALDDEFLAAAEDLAGLTADTFLKPGSDDQSE